MNWRSFGQYQFEFVCYIDVSKDARGGVQAHMPQGRYAKAQDTPLNRYGAGPFAKFKIPRNLKRAGVYAIVVDARLKYIGEAADLSARYNMGYGNISPKNCYKGGQETNCRLNNLIFQSATAGAGIALWFHETANYKAVERELRAELVPEWNLI